MDLASILASLLAQKSDQSAPSGPAPFGMAPEPDMLERLARAFHGGRDHGQRAFYNQTRAGLYNSDTAPPDANPYGGIGSSLNTRRALQGYEAQAIEDAILRMRGLK